MSHESEYTAHLDLLLEPDPPPFALLYRPFSGPAGRVEILVGDMTTVTNLTDLPLDPLDQAAVTSDSLPHDLLALVPYRQIAERGFDCQDDGTPLLAMRVRAQSSVGVEEALRRIPDRPVNLAEGAGFDIDDADYAATVRRILTDEIGHGAGANFVIRRTFTGSVPGRPTDAARTVFRRLLAGETGAYWTFLVHTGARTLVGASPERHASLEDGAVLMNPISGTFRRPAGGSARPGLLRFLADRKETDELYMVVDEELKMMARVCRLGVQVVGPRLKEMTRLAHTEYTLTGPSDRDVREILRETMFVPTVTGSPLQNACRVIRRHEPQGRGYYSGVLALIGRDTTGSRTLDSSVLIRTAELDAAGTLRIGVGATLVRHSDPASEVAETHAKAAALLAAIHGENGYEGSAEGQSLATHPEVLEQLERRNLTLSRFWLEPPGVHDYRRQELVGSRVLVIDGEDTFTAMLGQQLSALGPHVTIRSFDESFEPEDFDFVVVGAGPGDPRQDDDPKIAALRNHLDRLLAENRPFLAVCLGHQVLCRLLGLAVIRKDLPNQGLQREIPLLDRKIRAGFYNTFAALCDTDRLDSPRLPAGAIVTRDTVTQEVHALQTSRFTSLQFHPESLLTESGIDILGELLTALPSCRTATRN